VCVFAHISNVYAHALSFSMSILQPLDATTTIDNDIKSIIDVKDKDDYGTGHKTLDEDLALLGSPEPLVKRAAFCRQMRAMMRKRCVCVCVCVCMCKYVFN